MTIGHNGIAGDELRQFIERIERLEEEKRSLGEDIKEVYAEAKGRGYDTKTIRKIVALRRKSEQERAEEAATLDLYMHALGMLADTPLGRAAIRRDFSAELGAHFKEAAESGRLTGISRLEVCGEVVYERDPRQIDLEEAIAAGDDVPAGDGDDGDGAATVEAQAPSDDFPELPPQLDRRASRSMAGAEA